jgi:RHS repeat-associated protein
VYGKVRKVNRKTSSTKPDLEFKYDPMGNRVAKIVKPRNGGLQLKEEEWTYTYYIRDAQGNVMATYKSDVTYLSNIVNDSIKLKEVHVYGSSRVGIRTESVLTGGLTYTQAAMNPYDSEGRIIIAHGATDLTADALPDTNRVMRKKRYELSNHLGNVVAVISDKKLGMNTTAPTGGAFPPATYFTADVRSAGDYYSFGMEMTGRIFNTSDYRYGFNGKENDPEVVGTGQGTQDYGMRIYNPAIGKFLSVDPITREYPELTPYQFASNNPIMNIDLDGLEGEVSTLLFVRGPVLRPPVQVITPSNAPTIAPPFNNPFAQKMSRVRWTDNGAPYLLPYQDPTGGKLVVPDLSKYKTLTTQEHLQMRSEGKTVSGTEPATSPGTSASSQTKPEVKLGEALFNPEIRIALGDLTDLGNFAKQTRAQPYWEWGALNPQSGAFGYGSPNQAVNRLAYKLAIEAWAQNPNVTFHFNLSTKGGSGGRVDHNFWQKQSTVLSLEFETLYFNTALRERTTFYRKSGTIWKKTEPEVSDPPFENQKKIRLFLI